mmetsp:Transcript_100388/g.289932  ORF Transcript_100388/g.289932 Transcript_100388/m.289932 type:complete len:262 (+) Transcript_100388:414-1199(+)
MNKRTGAGSLSRQPQPIFRSPKLGNTVKQVTTRSYHWQGHWHLRLLAPNNRDNARKRWRCELVGDEDEPCGRCRPLCFELLARKAQLLLHELRAPAPATTDATLAHTERDELRRGLHRGICEPKGPLVCKAHSRARHLAPSEAHGELARPPGDLRRQARPGEGLRVGGPAAADRLEKGIATVAISGNKTEAEGQGVAREELAHIHPRRPEDGELRVDKLHCSCRAIRHHRAGVEVAMQQRKICGLLTSVRRLQLLDVRQKV